MAEVYVLPTSSQGVEQIERLHADLADARERGVDLGPRGPHIQAGGVALRHAADRLREGIEMLSQDLTRLGLVECEAQLASLRRLAREAAALADSVRNFPAQGK